jgi:uncharacterized protein
MTPHDKLYALKTALQKMERVAVAFSGGVDSAFLLSVAFETLGNRAVAVTADSPLFPERECSEAADFAGQLGVAQTILRFDAMEVPGFSKNSADRCYHCKKALFLGIKAFAQEHGIPFVADGSNADDTGDYRPGMAALKELGIVSPLRDAGMTKEDIRTLSRELGLLTWDKPSFACLASRFPYGQEITLEQLAMVGQAELVLLERGFRQVRVRCHGGIARIEVPAEDRRRLVEGGLAAAVYEAFRRIGFQYVTLDLLGYRTGSMNEVLSGSRKA